MGILSFFGINFKHKNKIYENSIILWEDDHLMIEIISSDNIDFATQETKRNSDFGDENNDGNGFANITSIAENPNPTINLNISKTELINLLESVELEKIEYIYYNGAAKPIESPKTIVYGKYNNGIFIESENEIVINIWFSSYNFSKIRETKIIEGLNAIGNRFDMILVDWYKNKIINLKNINELNKYFEIE